MASHRATGRTAACLRQMAATQLASNMPIKTQGF